MVKTKTKLYVEGGGNSKNLKILCRKGFCSFLEKAGLKGKMPRIVACGGREKAYDDFFTAIRNGEKSILLVDSEAPVSPANQADSPEQWRPWNCLKWTRPEDADDKDCHLMVSCMESWFIGDREALAAFFGDGFKDSRLPPSTRPVEGIPKDDVFNALSSATQDCKSKYEKGENSFRILEKIHPSIVTEKSPWAKRFVDQVKRKMDA